MTLTHVDERLAVELSVTTFYNDLGLSRPRLEHLISRMQERPKNTWRRGLHTELKTTGKTWNEAKKNPQQMCYMCYNDLKKT